MDLTLTAAGSRAALIYGRVQIAPEVALATVSGRYLYLLLVWGLGEIDAVEAIVTDTALTSKFSVTHYLGTASQGVDPWLAAVVSGYADTLRGTVHGRAVSLAYSVVRTSSSDLDIRRAFIGTLRGRLVYDPRTTSTVYSRNPALALADVLVAAGETMDWDSVETVADFNDENVNGQARWTLGMVFDRPTAVTSLAEELRAYAHCLIVPGPNGLRLVPDNAAATALALTHTDVMEGSLRLSRKSRRETPSVVRVEFTDTTTTPWGKRTAEAKLATVDTGDVPWRESNTPMHGIQSYAEAYRTAVERLNAYNLRDLQASFTMADIGLAVTPGDVISLTHPWGLSAKLLRVLSMSADEAGRWEVEAEEYDPAVYTNVVASEPTYGDTSLPSPFDVPAPTDLAAAEEVYQLENGTYSSRLRITWATSSYSYEAQSRVQVYAGATLIWSTLTDGEEAVTPAVQEGVAYSVRVALVATVGVTGEEATTAITAQGKGLVPTWEAGAALRGIEAGGEVRLDWDPAFDIDIWRYEVRWGATTDAWDDATRIDRVDGLRLVTRDIPAGTWRFQVKAIDSIGQYTATALTRDITVTLDTRAFFVDQYTLAYSAGDSSNIYTSTRRGGAVRRWSEIGTAVDTLWPNAADTYTDIAAAYDVGSASEWESAVADFGAVYTGQWQFDARAITALGSGDAITINYELSDNGSDWDTYTIETIKATAQYARVRVTAASGNALLQAGNVTVRLDVVAREESGIIATSASAAATAELSSTYAFTKAIVLTPQGVTSPPTAGAIAVYDNIDLTSTPNTFDIYLFASDGTQLSGSVSWRFQGV